MNSATEKAASLFQFRCAH